MDALTLSPKFQIVIPQKIRQALGLVAGQKIHAFVYEGRIELIPVKSVKSMRGFLKGIDTHVPRDKDRV